MAKEPLDNDEVHIGPAEACGARMPTGVQSPEKSLIALFALLISELQEGAPNVGLICRSEGKPATTRLTPGLAVPQFPENPCPAPL